MLSNKKLLYIIGPIAFFSLSLCSSHLRNNSNVNKSESVETTFGEIKDSVADADGNLYYAVKIGSQLWINENVKTTKYNDGTPIEHVTDDKRWNKMTSGGYCYQENDITRASLYGIYYNWYAVNSGKLAPEGWRVPTDEDWNVLEKYLSNYGKNRDGSRTGSRIGVVLAARTNWSRDLTEDNVGSTLARNNKTGFSALPGGYRFIDGLFYSQSNIGFWWSATEKGSNYAFDRHICFDENCLQRETRHKRWGLSVRFVKDDR